MSFFFQLVFFLIILFTLKTANAQTSESSLSNFYLFVGTYTQGKADTGIYIYKFDPFNGTSERVATGDQITNPSFLTVSDDGRFIYSCTESKMKNKGSVSSFRFDAKRSKLEFINKQPSFGENPVYISLYRNSKWLVEANYTDGNISVFPIDTNGIIKSVSQRVSYKGSSISKERQDHSHVHATVFSPDFKFLFVTDLGSDKIISYPVDSLSLTPLILNKKKSISSTPGSGPRHIVLNSQGTICYAIEELTETISVYQCKSGLLTSVQRITTRDTTPHNSYGSADIHLSPDGKFLYASNRGDINTIAIYSVDNDGLLTNISYQATLGDTPRNFTIDPTGNFLLVANQASNSIVVFKRNILTGLLSDTGVRIIVPSPSCLVIREIKSN